MKLLAASSWRPICGGITAPQGFRASGVSCGLKDSGKKDLALILVPEGSVCSGFYTQSFVRASCIDLCVQRLNSTKGRPRAVLINSGHANACTGNQGYQDALLATNALAQKLNLNVEEVLMCSTGIIGECIPMEYLLEGLNQLVQSVDTNGGPRAAKAILTTDLKSKEFAFEADLGGRSVRIGGMAKGSGMIHPNMATMLGFLACDVGIERDIWLSMTKRIVDRSFNAITVDGDTSTNDTMLAFAAGQMLPKRYWDDLEEGLLLLAQNLAQSIARDGEGANCLLEVEVQGANSEKEALLIARKICGSSLVKTAINGADPNWGRIIAAAANAGVSIDQNMLDLWLGPYQLIRNGEPLKFDRAQASKYIQNHIHEENTFDKKVIIRLMIGSGSQSAVAWGCDLSDQYIRINADYTT